MRRALSLRLRLALLVAIVVAVVVGIEGYLEYRVFERRGREDLERSALATAHAVADDLELRGASATPGQVRTVLHEFLAAAPTVRDIAAFAWDGGQLTQLGRTSTAAGDDALAAARGALERHETVWVGAGGSRTVGVPIVRDGRVAGAVAASTSFASIRQLSAIGREVTVLFAVPAMIVLTVLVDLLARRLVHRPIGVIRHTMARAGKADVGVRAPVDRCDEIGAVAEGLNEMLARLEQYQADLQTQVDEATQELRRKNAQLVENYQRVLRLRESLARAEQLAALGQLAANMAHQIGTPLNLISGYVQLMIEEARRSGHSLQRLETVEAQIGRVSTAVRSMLDSARAPALHRERLDLALLVEQVCELSRPALQAASVDLRLDVAPDLPSIEADPVQLELALLNLVSNALDAMPAGGRLEIAAGSRVDGVWVTVADTGEGIPEHFLPRVFEPWFTTKGDGGTGLGLSITRDVIALHGGTIRVSSDPGRGARLTIELPREESQRASAGSGPGGGGLAREVGDTAVGADGRPALPGRSRPDAQLT
jgi:two-component system NtrC family sensor kinase